MEDETRVRMHFAQTAKGLVQLDVTVEFKTVEETAMNARAAIDEYRKICEEKSLVLVQPAIEA